MAFPQGGAREAGRARRGGGDGDRGPRDFARARLAAGPLRMDGGAARALRAPLCRGARRNVDLGAPRARAPRLHGPRELLDVPLPLAAAARPRAMAGFAPPCGAAGLPSRRDRRGMDLVALRGTALDARAPEAGPSGASARRRRARSRWRGPGARPRPRAPA